MGTRGFVGFRYQGVTKAQYNHFDSYPEELGMQVLRDLQKAELTLDRLREIFAGIEPVKEDGVPSKELQQRYQGFTNTHVSNQTPEDWYCLLRETQGGLAAWLSDACTHMIVEANPGGVPYVYLVDLDEACLRAYEGGYSDDNKLVATWALDDLPDEATFLAAFAEEEDE